MLFGNPHEFAIWVDPVLEWSPGSTVEGLYILCVDGVYLIKRSSLSARSVTVSGESGFWMQCLSCINDGKQTSADGRDADLLFFSALISRGGVDDLPSSIDAQKHRLLEKLKPHGLPDFDSAEGVNLTPMETADAGWSVYLFFDNQTNEDLVIYSNLEDSEFIVRELRLPSGKMKEILSDLVEKTKFLDRASYLRGF